MYCSLSIVCLGHVLCTRSLRVQCGLRLSLQFPGPSGEAQPRDIPGRRTVTSADGTSAPWAAVQPIRISAQGSCCHLGSRVSLFASASESESTESSDSEPHEVYSSLLESESACVVTGIPDSGTECVLKHLLHWL